MYEQLIVPNKTFPYVGGLCEGFVEGSFGQATPPYKDNKGNWTTSGVWWSATTAWNTNFGGGNHANERPPIGLSVPVYFALGSTKDGHVAYTLPDGRVASSSLPGYQPSGYIYDNLDAMIADYAKYNKYCTYLGWSEYVGKARVVKLKGDDMIQDSQLDYDVISQTFKDATGRKLTKDEFKSQVGRTWQDALITFQGSEETAAWSALAQFGSKAKAEAWVKPGEADKKLAAFKQAFNTLIESK